MKRWEVVAYCGGRFTPPFTAGTGSTGMESVELKKRFKVMSSAVSTWRFILFQDVCPAFPMNSGRSFTDDAAVLYLFTSL